MTEDSAAGDHRFAAVPVACASGLCWLGLRVFFEEFDKKRWSLCWKIVGAGVDESDDGRSGFRFVERALGGPLDAFLVAAVELDQGLDGVFLPVVFDERIHFAGQVHDRFGLEAGDLLEPFIAGASSGRGGHGGEDVAAGSPQQIREATAIGVASGIDAAVVDSRIRL